MNNEIETDDRLSANPEGPNGAGIVIAERISRDIEGQFENLDETTQKHIREVLRAAIAGERQNTEKLITQWESRLTALNIMAEAYKGKKTDRARGIRTRLGTTHAMLDELKAAVGS